jgi:hypothetical protein
MAKAAGTDSTRCAGANIVFDVSSIEHIFLRAEDVLANSERFWKEDGAYRLAKLWHELNNIPIPLDEWRENLERVVSTPASERSAPRLQRLGGFNAHFRNRRCRSFNYRRGASNHRRQCLAGVIGQKPARYPGTL